MTDLSRPRRVGILVIIEVTTVIPLLSHISSGSDTKGIKFRIEICLRLDERSAIISHGLISRIGILGEYGVTSGDKYQD